MPLLSLPDELLLEIFDSLSPSFFRKDLRRLAICKRWLQIALPVLYRSVELSRHALRSLIASGTMAEQPALRDNTETLDLYLNWHQCGNSASSKNEEAQRLPSLSQTDGNLIPIGSAYQVSEDPLNEDLRRLAVVAKQSRRLRTSRIRAWRCTAYRRHGRADDYTPLPGIRDLLSVGNLRVPVLDLTADLAKTPEKNGQLHHICPLVGPLLLILHTFHLRLRTVCPTALTPPDSSEKLSLSVLVVNSYPNLDITLRRSARHSALCSSSRFELPKVKPSLQEQAEALVSRMSSPKIVRILSYSSGLLLSFDILTGEIMELHDDMAWDEDSRDHRGDNLGRF